MIVDRGALKTANDEDWTIAMETSEFDYIVVGAGSAGAVVAARLSEDPNISVLLLEAGGEDKGIWLHIPLGVGKILTNAKYVWQYFTQETREPPHKPVYWPKGRMLGGSSSVNGMVFVRGSKASWDEWRNLGCTGWGYDDVLPYFKKMEHRDGGDAAYRGQGGPITVTDVAHHSPVSEAFKRACNELGAPHLEDYNIGDNEGVADLQMSIRDGLRCSTAVGYLKPARKRKNLTVQTDSLADKLIFEGNRCIGVHYLRHNKHLQARARREVILCAGSIESPAILERSGIGNPENLEKAGVQMFHQLNEVGENLHDHLQVRMSFEIEGERTVNDVLGNPVSGALELLKYIFTRRGLFATSTVVSHAIMKSRPESTTADTKIQIALMSGADRYSGNGSGTDSCPGMTLGTFQIRPKSRGSVHIVSRDPANAPEIRVNYLEEEQDRIDTIAGLRLIRNVAAQMGIKGHVRRELLPGPNIVSDTELLQYARETGQTSWHPISTCRMGSDEKAVVDTQLRVRGLDGLRIADASIMPTMVSTNTNAPSIMIGEKAAAMILQGGS